MIDALTIYKKLWTLIYVFFIQAFEMRVPVAADYSVAVSGTRSSRFSFLWRLENDKN